MLRDEALTHPMVLGELACGTLPAPRERTLGDIGLLRPATQASRDEVMAFIEREKLYRPEPRPEERSPGCAVESGAKGVQIRHDLDTVPL